VPPLREEEPVERLDPELLFVLRRELVLFLSAKLRSSFEVHPQS
jgi:hypothetical protein